MADRTPGPLRVGDVYDAVHERNDGENYVLLVVQVPEAEYEHLLGTRVALYPADQPDDVRCAGDPCPQPNTGAAEGTPADPACVAMDEHVNTLRAFVGSVRKFHGECSVPCRPGCEMDVDAAEAIDCVLAGLAAEGTPADEPTEADPLAAAVVRLLDSRYHADFVGPERWLRLLADWFDVSERVADMRGDEIQLDLRALADDLERLRALVGGRSAAPTRDEVREALSDALMAWFGLPAADKAMQLDMQADAVVALLSRSAAEPPEDDDVEALRSVVRHALIHWSPKGPTPERVLLAEWDDTDWADSTWTPAEQKVLRDALDHIAAERDAINQATEQT